jgi:hypothetical protein
MDNCVSITAEHFNENEKKTKYYTNAHREAQQRYREKNRDEYNKSQRELYNKLKEDVEWKQKFNERSKNNNLIYRQKKREELMKDPNYVIRGRGRPRKNPAVV